MTGLMEKLIRNMANISQLQTFFIALVLSVVLSNCTFVSWPVSALTTAVDVGLTVETGKSTSEHVASVATKMDCQWSRLFSDWKICLTHEEYVDNLMIMNCQIYSWDFLNKPYCKENG